MRECCHPESLQRNVINNPLAFSSTGPQRQAAQVNLVEAVLEHIQGMSVVKSYGLEKDNNQAVLKTVRQSCDRVLGEGGGTLSGGEKQRISIARVILKDAPIIILDEATASVDPENEDLLQAAIDALTHNKTIIMIAHRLKTVCHADQILVLNNGKIVQQGTHEQLAAKEGLYREFLNAREKAAGWKLV